MPLTFNNQIVREPLTIHKLEISCPHLLTRALTKGISTGEHTLILDPENETLIIHHAHQGEQLISKANINLAIEAQNAGVGFLAIDDKTLEFYSGESVIDERPVVKNSLQEETQPFDNDLALEQYTGDLVLTEGPRAEELLFQSFECPPAPDSFESLTIEDLNF
jgi:hypothetical protein